MNPRAIEIALHVLSSPNANEQTVKYANLVLSTVLNGYLVENQQKYDESQLSNEPTCNKETDNK